MQYTEQRARKEGLQYTGAYERSREELKPRLEQLRAQGYRAIIANIPPNPLSRGYHGMGYSIYVEQKYFQDCAAERMYDSIKRIPVLLHNAQEEYNNKVLEILKKEAEYKQWLKDNGYPETPETLKKK